MPKGRKGHKMPNTNTADTVEEAAADTAAHQSENQPAGDSLQKTFTEQEVDAKIKARIDKQNAKHAEELAAVSARVKELEESAAKVEAERDTLKKQKEIAELTQRIATEKGVPANMLHGETEEELTKSAEAVAAYKESVLASVGTAPVITDSGEGKEPPRDSRAVFAEFMQQNFRK